MKKQHTHTNTHTGIKCIYILDVSFISGDVGSEVGGKEPAKGQQAGIAKSKVVTQLNDIISCYNASSSLAVCGANYVL